jgi:hypothetical protein
LKAVDATGTAKFTEAHEIQEVVLSRFVPLDGICSVGSASGHVCHDKISLGIFPDAFGATRLLQNNAFIPRIACLEASSIIAEVAFSAQP